MIRPSVRLTTIALLLLGAASAQIRTPPGGPEPTDIFSAFHLPAYDDAPGTVAGAAFLKLQVGQRAGVLGLTGGSATDAWRIALAHPDDRRAASPKPRSRAWTVFNGSTASELNQLIADARTTGVRIASAGIIVDQPIEIRRRDLSLDLGAAQITTLHSAGYLLRIEDATGISLTGGLFNGGDSAILVNASTDIEIRSVEIADLAGAGIVVTESSRVMIADNRISGLQLAGIMIHRGAAQVTVENNKITGCRGYSNVTAGIVLTDREVDLASNPRAIFGSDGYWVVTQPIVERLHPPHDNLISDNTISGGLSSGIYVDGAIRNVIVSNRLRGNAKEGLCLDDGSTANVVAGNSVYGNGQRWGQPDSVLELDSVLSGGRLPDGTAAEKVPGISVDNAAYNVIFANDIQHNYGGGIKLVRTGYFNAIGLNTLLADNEGAGDDFHFFGISLGSAGGSSVELDFTPSRGNIVFSNMVRGSHYSGIFFESGSDHNTVLFNMILDANYWALESANPMENTSVNNLTTLPSRNIGSGLDPALGSAASTVID